MRGHTQPHTHMPAHKPVHSHPAQDPVHWRKAGIKCQAFIYSEHNFARVACVIHHGWWGCNIRDEPVNLQRASLKEFMYCCTAGCRGRGCRDFKAMFVGWESEIYNLYIYSMYSICSIYSIYSIYFIYSIFFMYSIYSKAESYKCSLWYSAGSN